MHRFVSAVTVAVVSIVGASILWAQVPVNKEPHNRSLLYTNFLRIFDVTVPAGDAEADHLHDRDMATLVLGNSTTRTRKQGEDWGAPHMDAKGTVTIVEYTGSPVVHGVQNVDTATYHAIAVENNRERGWPAAEPVMAPGTSVTQKSRSFVIYDVRLNAGTTTTHHAHTRATVIVLLDGAISQGGIGGEEPIRISQPGQWLTLPPGQAHDLTVVGDGEAHVIEIEVL